MATTSAHAASPQAVRQLVGKPVAEAIATLVCSFPRISKISFAAYRAAPGLDARLARTTDPSVEIRQDAENLHQRFGVPFWDAILSISMARGQIPAHYVELAMMHDKSPDEYRIDVRRAEVSRDRICSISQELRQGFSLALSSKVEMDNGGVAHIPMMDFRCAPSRQNAEIVKTALKAMGEEAGVLVDSGRSFHFYGVRLLDKEAWIRFLAMGILFSPIVDARYVAHRLADGACRLRVGTGPNKLSPPMVVEVF
jgi:hypothetical protein